MPTARRGQIDAPEVHTASPLSFLPLLLLQLQPLQGEGAQTGKGRRSKEADLMNTVHKPFPKLRSEETDGLDEEFYSHDPPGLTPRLLVSSAPPTPELM